MTCPAETLERAFTLVDVARRARDEIADGAPMAQQIGAHNRYLEACGKLVEALSDTALIGARVDLTDLLRVIYA